MDCIFAEYNDGIFRLLEGNRLIGSCRTEIGASITAIFFDGKTYRIRQTQSLPNTEFPLELLIELAGPEDEWTNIGSAVWAEYPRFSCNVYLRDGEEIEVSRAGFLSRRFEIRQNGLCVGHLKPASLLSDNLIAHFVTELKPLTRILSVAVCGIFRQVKAAEDLRTGFGR